MTVWRAARPSRARRASRPWTLSVALAALATAQAGCTAGVGELSVSILVSSEPDEDPLSRIAAFVRVRVDGPAGRAGPEVFPLRAGGGTIYGVPTGESQVVTVEGLGPESNPVSRGRTVPITLGPGANRVALFVGLIDTFSHVPRRFDDGRPTGMREARAFHTANLLGDGSVLIAGGTGAAWRPEDAERPLGLRTVSLVDGNALSADDSTCGGSDQRCLRGERVAHSATLLPSGNVLIAGGLGGKVPVASTEVYQATSRTIYPGPPLRQPRFGHGAVLSDQRVLVAGGQGTAGTLSSVETYDQGQVNPAPQLLQARRAFASVALADGTVVAIGGLDDKGDALATTETLAPGAAQWRAGPALRVPRAYATATRLADGGVLVVGGLTKGGQATASVERLDLAASTSRELGELKLPRWAHTTTALADDRLLVVGGFASSLTGSPVDLVEELVLGSATGLNVLPRYRLREARAGHAATLLPSGLLLVTGGLSAERPTASAEVFVP
ncbi:MAG: hypothetical protein IT371_01215 [Deltaproteobacteria bacterium]|nr:hypothetical protein [Deltaproteobacteria bacterium]